MNSFDSNLPPDEPSPEKPPRGEEELLENESQLARGALQRLRGEIMESLRHSADVSIALTRSLYERRAHTHTSY
jgi:hypothetical protein